MPNEKPSQDTERKADAPVENCGDDVQLKTEIDGKNDSGPDPEVHGKDLPPQ